MNARSNPVTLVLVVVAVVVLAVVVDLVRPSTASSRPDPVPAGPAVAGAWYCVAGATTEGSTVRYVAAAPRGASSDPADVAIDLFRSGVSDPGVRERLFPGTSTVLQAPENLPAVAASVRWFEQPAAASRIWRFEGAGLPSGLVEGPCATGPSPTWYVPGMTTAGGAQARLYLANPFTSDASVAVSFTTPDGEVAPILLENTVVPARTATVVDINEFLPRTADLGVVVASRSGRVVVEGVQVVNAAIGGIDGTTLAPATPRLAEVWTVPWSLSDPVAAATEPAPAGSRVADDVVEASSWVWVSNPGEEDAAVVVTLHLGDGGILPDLGEELVVPAGGQLRVDLGTLLPAGRRAAGVTVRSNNGVPVAASVGTVVVDGDGRTGLSIQAGAENPDTVWVLSGGRTAGRREFLNLTNPAGELAVVDVSVWNGSTVLRPAELQGLEVPAGALAQVELLAAAIGDVADHTIFVAVREGAVVAGRRAFAVSGRLEWVAHTGASAAVWRGGEAVPVVRLEAGMLQRLGTSLGLSTR